ncbi:MAG: hypothetical protein AAF183_18080 [Pseudomonadota bacterium]
MITDLTEPRRLVAMRPAREPDFKIGPADNPYMLRWWLVPRNDEFNVYYHVILHDDDDRALHDHPWPSLSIVVGGSLREITETGHRILGAGDVVYRAPDRAHRLELLYPEQPAETLFITGPRCRDWGFHCPKAWVPWKQFVDGDEPGRVGRGCGEMA